ncbi:MAG: DUF998 domain-containing protein [Candidatus Bathyarchaeia archaeon]
MSDRRRYALFGIIGPLAAFFFITVSILLSPWFCWGSNALSDLGHAVKSSVAALFNLGLLATGFLTTIYSITAFRNHAKYTSYCLLASAFLLQLVATFDEVYGFLHFLVSVLLFVSFGLASIIYAVEKRSVLASAAFAVGLASWTLYWAGVYTAGIAVPETISSLAIVSWVLLSAFRILQPPKT